MGVDRTYVWLLLAAVLCGCGEPSHSRRITSVAHAFDPDLQGLQRLWASQVEQRLAAGIDVDGAGLPTDWQPAAEVGSQLGALRGRLSPAPQMAELGALQTFVIDIRDATGAAPAGLSVEIAGGMPLHSHGLPTVPAVRELAPGRFEVTGVRFSMRGWWQLLVGVAGGERFDTLCFDFFVQ